MDLNTQDLKRRLKQYGHVDNPFGERRGFWPVEDIDKMSLRTPEIVDAVRSYQSYFAPTAATLGMTQKHHPGRSSAMITADGDVGPVTMDLLEAPRCGHPDYGAATYSEDEFRDVELDQAEARGSGNWYGCHSIGNFHCAKVLLNSSIPTFLKDHFDEIWARVVEAYDEIGLRLELVKQGSDYNTTLTFQRPTGSWIGLAIVGTGSLSCASRIWAKFDNNYRPNDLITQWTTLLKHEYGHNCGMDHSSGGVMNPYLLQGLPVSWVGDVSYSYLKRAFGGERVAAPPGTPEPPKPRERQLVIAWKTPDGRYEDVSTLPLGERPQFFPV